MWRSTSISSKTWASLGILIAGYLLSIIFGFLAAITQTNIFSREPHYSRLYVKT